MAIPIVSFTAGGIDVESIVQGLMQVERQPITSSRPASRKRSSRTTPCRGCAPASIR